MRLVTKRRESNENKINEKKPVDNAFAGAARRRRRAGYGPAPDADAIERP
jgi:hypothetical protein